MSTRALLSLALVAALGCSKAPEPAARTAKDVGTPWFRDVSRERGIDFVHVAGPEVRYWFPEIMGSGVCWIDVEGDGDSELYFVQGGDLARRGQAGVPANRLFAYDGARFSDVTERAGVGDRGYGMGCATGDIEGDGDLDLYVTNVGPNVLFRNAGDGTFADVTEAAGVGDPRWGTSTAFFDADGDGDLDLFVANYVNWSEDRELDCKSGYGARDYCSPNNYNAPASDVLYVNQGDGTFVDGSEPAGFSSVFGNGLGVAVADFDSDGRTDVYVANDQMPNQLWINLGGGRFEDRALVLGCAVNMNGTAEAGMGVTSVDVENDGDLDLFMTHLRDETNTFYRNDGGVFQDATARTGLASPSIQFTGFGVGFADFDLDGRLDLFVTNGRVGDWKPRFVEDKPYAEPNQLFRGLGGGRFEEVLPRGGVVPEIIENSRSVAFCDFDGDGDVDVAINDNSAPGRLLENVAERRGRFATLVVELRPGVAAQGARVRLTAGGATQWRTVTTAYGYCSANDARLSFGLGDAARVDEVLVLWPDGTRERFGPLAADALHDLRQGAGERLPE